MELRSFAMDDLRALCDATLRRRNGSASICVICGQYAMECDGICDGSICVDLRYLR